MTADEVRRLLDYDAINGLLTWRVSFPRVKAGQEAGYLLERGYVGIRIGGREYKAHRVAWLHFYGVWPEGDIDHIDHDKTNNRICNLRDVSRSVNTQNKRRARSDSTTGFLGVSKNGSGFKAAIQVDGRRTTIGTFSTPEKAYEAYLVAKRQMHEGNTL
jgi:hypothetical protein